MKHADVYVFLGPSLKGASARKVLDAHYLPPARQADILSLVRSKRPAVIALIDGEFGQSLSVWHKEILFALEEGVVVYGASSMGALRAAELAPFGMRGVGQIFEDYQSERIIADDEVALTYGPPELEYFPISLPMVNIRATLAAAGVAGLLGERECETVCAVLKKIFFADRTPSRVSEALMQMGWERAKVAQIFEAGLVDQKALDAEALLQQIARHPMPQPSLAVPFSLNHSYAFGVLDQQDRMSKRGVRFREIAKFITLHDKNFSESKTSALNRTAVLVLAKVWGVTVTPEQECDEQSRFRRRHSLDSGDDLKAWLEHNDLDEVAFTKLMKESAIVRRIHDWILSMQGSKEFTQPLLDHLRLTNTYGEWENRSYNSREIIRDLNASETDEYIHATPESLDDLLSSHLMAFGWARGMSVEEWLREAGFQGTNDLRHELIKTVTSQRLLNKFVLELLTATPGFEEREMKNV